MGSSKGPCDSGGGDRPPPDLMLESAAMERPGAENRIGLVLSGGGARAFAHIGVLRVLSRAGARFDVVAGTSMGAIIGALYAAGATADDIYEVASGVGWRDVVDISLQAGLIKGDKLEALLAEHLPPDFADLKIPLAVTTTDVENGDAVVLMEGDLVKAVRASSSFPGAIEPLLLYGRVLADGGIVNNLPVSAATLLGATRTIASDVTPARHSVYRTPDEEGNWLERMVATVKLERRNPMAQMLLRSSDIMQSILVDIQASIHPPDLRIRMSMPQYRIESFKDLDDLVAIGEATAEAALAARGGWDKVVELGARVDQLLECPPEGPEVETEDAGVPANGGAHSNGPARKLGNGAKKPPRPTLPRAALRRARRD